MEWSAGTATFVSTEVFALGIDENEMVSYIDSNAQLI